MALVVLPNPAQPQLPNIQLFNSRLEDCAIGSPCMQTVSGWAAVATPVLWSAIGLPPGMAIRTGSGVTSSWVSPGDAEIFGSPATAGDYNVTITLTDAIGNSTSQTVP